MTFPSRAGRPRRTRHDRSVGADRLWSTDGGVERVCLASGRRAPTPRPRRSDPTCSTTPNRTSAVATCGRCGGVRTVRPRGDLRGRRCAGVVQITPVRPRGVPDRDRCPRRGRPSVAPVASSCSPHSTATRRLTPARIFSPGSTLRSSSRRTRPLVSDCWIGNSTRGRPRRLSLRRLRSPCPGSISTHRPSWRS